MNQKKERPPGPQATYPESGSPLYRAQTRHTIAKAAQEEMKLKKLEGILVLKADVEKMQFATYHRVRNGLLNLAARVTGLIAAEAGVPQPKCFAIITKEVQQILGELTQSALPPKKKKAPAA